MTSDLSNHSILKNSLSLIFYKSVIFCSKWSNFEVILQVIRRVNQPICGYEEFLPTLRIIEEIFLMKSNSCNNMNFFKILKHA